MELNEAQLYNLAGDYSIGKEKQMAAAIKMLVR
jgi:hypothetical protein